MKKITAALALVISFSSFAKASDVSPEMQRKASVHSFKTILSVSAESITSLQKNVESSVRRYKQLGFFDLAAKNRLGRENCAEIEANTGASAMMLVFTLEQAQADLEKTPEFNNQRTLQEFTKITAYFNEVKNAQSTCSNPAQSLQHIGKAAQLLNEVSTYMEENLPGIL